MSGRVEGRALSHEVLRSPPKRHWSAFESVMVTEVGWPCVLLLVLVFISTTGPSGAPSAGAQPASLRASFEAACSTANPFLAVAVFPNDPRAEYSGRAIVATRDTARNYLASQWVLAMEDKVGSVYGLAYDWRKGHLYAAAFPFYSDPAEPDGLGAIYRVDLNGATPVVSLWARIDAGTRAIGASRYRLAQVGQVGLGDIELSHDGEYLFVANLASNKIHALSTATATIAHVFSHGASEEPWASNARLLGLGVYGDRVFHGVVDSRIDPSLPGALSGHVFASHADGREMTKVLEFEFPERPTRPWGPWSRPEISGPVPGLAQPWIADIVVDASGGLLLGLRNRGTDVVGRTGGGDIVRFESIALGRWEPAAGGRFIDDLEDKDSAMGALAILPAGDRVVGTVWYPLPPLPGTDWWRTTGLAWWRTSGGRPRGPADGLEAVAAHEPNGLGDVEALCAPANVPTPHWPTPMPTLTPTPTATLTPTTTPSATMIAPTATPRSSATPSPVPTIVVPQVVYLPLAERSSCRPRDIDAVLVLDLSTSMLRDDGSGMSKLDAALAAAESFIDQLSLRGARPYRDRVAIVGFNQDGWIAVPFESDLSRIRDELSMLPAQVREQSRIDLALHTAARALKDRRPGALSIAVVLSDGLVNHVPPAEDGKSETTVLQAAQLLWETGAALHVIGLGAPEDIAEDLLRDTAGPSGTYHGVQRAMALEALYRHLGSRARCPE